MDINLPTVEAVRKRRSTTLYAYVQPENKAWLEAKSLEESKSNDGEVSLSELLDLILGTLRAKHPVAEEFYTMKRPRRGHKYNTETRRKKTRVRA